MALSCPRFERESDDGANSCGASSGGTDHRLHQLGGDHQDLPLTTVRSVLAASGKASVRQRDLPAHVVMYYTNLNGC